MVQIRGAGGAGGLGGSLVVGCGGGGGGYKYFLSGYVLLDNKQVYVREFNIQYL